MHPLARSSIRRVLAATLLLTACDLLEPDDGGGGGFGFRLAVLRSEGLVTSLDDGAQEQRVTEAGTSQDPATNRSGTSIAILYGADGATRGLYRTSFLSGATLDPLAEPASGETFESPAWSPDGQSIVVVETQAASSRLVRVSADGGTPEPIAGSARGKRFPQFLGTDSDQLVVVDAVTKEIELLSIASGSTSPLSASNPLHTDTRPAVSSDGSKLAFVDRDNGGALTIVDLATDARTVLTLDAGGTPARPAFSPDDRYVGFVLGSQIYALAADNTSESPTLLQSGSDFAWGRQ